MWTTKALYRSSWMLANQTVTMAQQSGIILPEPGVNVQVHVEEAINEVVSEPTEVEIEGARRGMERPVIP